MAVKVSPKILALCVLTFLTASFSLAQDNAALAGKWNMTSETDGDPVHWTLLLKAVDGKLTGSLNVNEG